MNDTLKKIAPRAALGKVEERHLLKAERLLVGMLAINGLIVVACVSGLPSSSCAAMAETYDRAVVYFGSAGVMAFLGLAGFLIHAPRWRLNLWISYIAAAASFSVFMLSVNASQHNLILATKFCFSADSHRSEHIELRAPRFLEWVPIFQSWDNAGEPVPAQ